MSLQEFQSFFRIFVVISKYMIFNKNKPIYKFSTNKQKTKLKLSADI